MVGVVGRAEEGVEDGAEWNGVWWGTREGGGRGVYSQYSRLVDAVVFVAARRSMICMC